ALLVVSYALAVTVLGAVARAIGAVSLISVLDAVTVPALRTLLAASVSVGVATSTVGPVIARPAVAAVAEAGSRESGNPNASPLPTLTMHRLPDASGEPTNPSDAPSSVSPTTASTDTAPPSTTSSTAPDPGAASPVPPAGVAAPVAGQPDAGRWT